MSTSSLLFACLSACIAASFSDWFFFGFLFHDKYQAYPEVWRVSGGADERRAVALSSVVGVLTPLAFVGLCALLHVGGAGMLALLAAIIWIMTALPLLTMNYLFMKMHPLTLLAHALGWLAKLGVSAVAVAVFLPQA